MYGDMQPAIDCWHCWQLAGVAVRTLEQCSRWRQLPWCVQVAHKFNHQALPLGQQQATHKMQLLCVSAHNSKCTVTARFSRNF